MVANSKLSDEFFTPQPIVDLAKAVFNAPIDFDPYGHPQQLVPARDMHTLATHDQPWPTAPGMWWCNPPFSSGKECLPRMARHCKANPEINALVLCLAAPGSLYWRQWVWSIFGPRRIAWLPRVKFMQIDPITKELVPAMSSISYDTALLLFTAQSRLISRFERYAAAFASPEVAVIHGGNP